MILLGYRNKSWTMVDRYAFFSCYCASATLWYQMLREFVQFDDIISRLWCGLPYWIGFFLSYLTPLNGLSLSWGWPAWARLHGGRWAGSFTDDADCVSMRERPASILRGSPNILPSILLFKYKGLHHCLWPEAMTIIVENRYCFYPAFHLYYQWWYRWFMENDRQLHVQWFLFFNGVHFLCCSARR